MLSFESPALLRWLDILDRAKSFAFRRNRGREEAGRNLERFYERVWRDAAARIGATIEPLGQGVFEIARAGVKTRVLNNSTAMDDLATHCVVRTKPVIYRLLLENDLPVPRHLEFSVSEISRAARFLHALGNECVIKPASDTGGGQGVTTGVTNRKQLARAAWAAGRGGRSILIEEQVSGENYRLLYLDGKLLDAVLRRPPSVIADGRSSVEALVRSANDERVHSGALSHGLISFDFELERTLAKQRWSLRSVPPAGTLIRLKTAINENGACDNCSVVSRLGPELIEEGARAAAIAGVRLAGVDVITTDPGASLKRVGGVILEVNSPPGYFWHYRKTDGPFPVAEHVLQKLLF